MVHVRVVEGKAVGGSDIMTVANVRGNLKKAEIIAKIEEMVGLPFDNPFEFHLLTDDEFERWKRIFKPKLVELESPTLRIFGFCYPSSDPF